jgi:uncharacterized protein YigE (DUF2233 family)
MRIVVTISRPAKLLRGMLRPGVFTIGLAAIAFGSISAQELAWDQLAEGLTVTVWKPGARCEDGVPPLYVVRVDPEHFRFGIHYFRDEGLSRPPTIREWQRRTHASVIVNAGLFREDYSYLGLLLKDGRSLGGRRHQQWQGLFVAEPVAPGQRKARVLDLMLDAFADDHPAYREAAQSLMLLDRTGKPRVRITGKRAQQTIVGEDGAGQILLVKTSGLVTLRALAECLRDEFPVVHHAMAMDGGDSSDLLIAAELWPNPTDARPWSALVGGSQMPHIPLPAVIGIFPRTDGSRPPKGHP